MDRTRTLQVDGHVPTVGGMHRVVVASATAYLDGIHRAKCYDDTPILFARMDCHGLGEDLNQAVRMFAVAISQRRQLILLPPEPEARRDPKGCALPTSVKLTAKEPWHWLSGQDIPLSSILVTSSCQSHLMQRQPEVMEAIAQSSVGNATQTAARLGAKDIAAAGRESISLWRVNLAVSRHVPRIFQRQGLLWWFQVLTSYLVRVQPPLSDIVQSHAAMKPFIVTTPAGGAATDEFRWLGWAIRCGRKYCDGVGPGWMPTARFDVGAHIRLGDACRQKHVPKHYLTHVRRCDVNLTTVLRKVRANGVHNGTLFIASDSQAIIDEVAAGGALPFVASYLAINRSRFDTAAPTERLTARAIRLQSMVEALMDMLLLSRSSVVVGKMMSNFPRMALQLRVQPPRSHGAAGAYLALDDRPWCSRTSCREGYLETPLYTAARKKELKRNPPLDDLPRK